MGYGTDIPEMYQEKTGTFPAIFVKKKNPGKIFPDISGNLFAEWR
jgi:hypothetical protein